MEFYKFINENEVQKYKGGFVVIDNRIYTNPTEETIRKAGYKVLAEAPMPECNPETEYIERTFVDGESITAVYTVKQIEFEPIEDEINM